MPFYLELPCFSSSTLRCNTNQMAQYLRIYPHIDVLTGKMSIDPLVTDPVTGKSSLISSSVVDYNLCGEFSAAHITGRSIDTLITDWINQTPGDWQNRARQVINDTELTGIPDIKNMLDQYNCSYKDFLTPFKDKIDPVLGVPIVTPNQLKTQIDQGNALIIGVNIDQQGNLAQGNIGHWVVVEKVAPQGVNNGQVNAQVQIYNPLMNSQQVVNYDTLIKASGNFKDLNAEMYPPDQINPNGLWVDLASCKR